MARDFEYFRNELDRLRPQVENPDVVRLIENLIASLERQHQETSHRFDRLAENLRELDTRILTVENSRVFRLLHRISHTFRAWKIQNDSGAANARAYELWLERQQHAAPPEQWFRDAAAKLLHRPKFSIVLHLDRPRQEWLEATVAAVQRQSYPDWELCACDDASPAPWLGGYLETLSNRDSRIHFVRSAEPMGAASSLNRAMILSTGEYIATLDQHSVLLPHAFYHAAVALQDQRFDLLYADHDHFSASSSRERPCFKPGWSPELLSSAMYLGRFLAVSRAALTRAGGFPADTGGRYLHALAQRVSGSPATVHHIPLVLVSERETTPVPAKGHSSRTVTGAPLASLVICSRNAKLLAKCLASIERKTAYSNHETVVVEHRAASGPDPALSVLVHRSNCVHIVYNGAFDFAEMNNRGASAARGEILVFMNDDVRPLDPSWLETLIAQVQRPEIGIAGALLLYPSGLIQHAGMAIGIMDGAGHPHRGTSGGGFWNWSFHTRNVSAVTGACLAIRREVFEQLNGFDLQFPVNYNDVDLCLRARQAGFEVIYDPAARLEHAECRTRRPGVSWQERDRWRPRWGHLLEKGDPYFSRHLARDREDCSLADG